MAIKHKVLKDFQLITEDKRIVIIKAKTIIENYKFKNKNELVTVPIDVIKNNTDYFANFDWKEELQTFLRTNKIPQPAIITKKIVPFIETLMGENDGVTREIIVEKEVVKEVIVEKPKIVEKEVIVEKPKIIEKEVIVEKIVSDDSLSVELESKINKLKAKETQLDKELEEINQREAILDRQSKKLTELEKSLEDKSKEVEDKESSLNSLEVSLAEREKLVAHKENNLSEYITLSTIREKVDQYKRQGYIMDTWDRMVNELR